MWIVERREGGKEKTSQPWRMLHKTFFSLFKSLCSRRERMKGICVPQGKIKPHNMLVPLKVQQTLLVLHDCLRHNCIVRVQFTGQQNLSKFLCCGCFFRYIHSSRRLSSFQLEIQYQGSQLGIYEYSPPVATYWVCCVTFPPELGLSDSH